MHNIRTQFSMLHDPVHRKLHVAVVCFTRLGKHVLVLKARHHNMLCLLLGVPDKALGWFPLGFVEADLLFELLCNTLFTVCFG